MNISKYAVALTALVTSTIAAAGATPVGLSLGSVLGVPVGTAIAQATGLPIEAIGGGAVFAVAAVVLVVGIRMLRRKQGR